MQITSRHCTILILIILAYLGLGISYALATPPLEASDEYKHYPFVQFVQTEGRLPLLEPENPGLWLQEAAQPPLYYLLMAGVTAGVDSRDLAEVHHKNPQAFIGNPGQVGNKNLIIHDAARERFPWQGSILAVYMIRFVSLLLGVGTIWVVARLGLRMFKPTVALLAAALTAFNPMFLFVYTAVNNDSLAILLGSLGLLLLVGIWQDLPDLRRGWWRYLLLGLVLGLGLLTKLSLGGLLALTGMALAWQAWRKQRWELLFGGGLLVLATAVLISGWWFVRNWQLYGDLTGLTPFVAVQGTRDAALTLAGWVDEFGTFYRSYWGLFGGVNVAAPEVFYVVMNLLALAGFVGLLKWLWVKANREHFARVGGWLLVAWIGVLLMLLIRWNIISPAFQGRLIFPAIGAINVLWAVGLLALGRAGWQTKMAVGLSIVLFVIAALLPWLSIRPVYALPEPLTAVPTDAQLAEPILFTGSDGQMRLVGVEMMPEQSVIASENPVIVTLYWQMDEPVTDDYISSVHLLGRDLASVGQIDRYPAMGLIPTSRWEVGNIYQDVYHVYVDKGAVAPSQLLVAVSLYDDVAERPLPATNPAGVLIDPVFVGEGARLEMKTAVEPQPEIPLNAPFEHGIRLLGLDGIDNAANIPLMLYWQANDTPAADYTVFVQLLDQEGNWLAGADAPPVNNFYPTSLWQVGDSIDDLHILMLPDALPSGNYSIIIGLYDPITGVRLLRTDSRGDFVEIPLIIEDEPG